MKIQYDIVIENGLVVDGNLNPPENKSLGIKDGKILEITNDLLSGKIKIDATNKIVTPGFIDIHSHSDAIAFIDNRMESKVFQGVTTEVVGNCGQSLIPISKEYKEVHLNFIKSALAKSVSENLDFDAITNSTQYFEELEKNKVTTNIISLIGHGTLRTFIMGFSSKEANDEQIKKMKIILEQELKAGAWGLSLGLFYPPGSYSTKNEIVELCKVLKKYDAILTVHLRNESKLILEAVEEMIDIARTTKVHVHISHLKILDCKQHGKIRIILEKIKKANEFELLNITYDQYPYTSSSTNLLAILPGYLLDGGMENFIKKLRFDNNILNLLEDGIISRGGPEKVQIIKTNKELSHYDGKTLAEISKLTGKSFSEVAKDCLLATGGGVSCIFHSISENDMLEIMKDEKVAIASDGYAFPYNYKDLFGTPHPRSFGTFPRFIKICRERNLMPLEKIIYKITGLPSELLGLKNKGKIKKSWDADLVIFNYKKIEDKSTFLNPYEKPIGIEYVINNGKIILEHGNQTNEKNGTIIKR